MAKLVLEIENGCIRATIGGVEVVAPWYLCLQADQTKVRRLGLTYPGERVDNGDLEVSRAALRELDPLTRAVLVLERVDPVEPQVASKED